MATEQLITCGVCEFPAEEPAECPLCRIIYCTGCESRHECPRAVIVPRIRKGVYVPREYQIEAADACYEQWRFGNFAILIVKATGLGKTIVIAEVCLRWPEECGRILIAAHRKELIDQAAEKVGRHLGEKPEIEMAERRAGRHGLLSDSNVIVTSVQTQNAGSKCKSCGGDGCRDCIEGIVRRMQRFDPFEFGLLVIDEAHHATAKSYRRMLSYYRQNPDLKVLMVTATPKRADKIGMKNVADAVAFEMGILEGINQGWLVPIQQKYVIVEGLDFSQCRTKTASSKSDFTDESIAQVMMGGVPEVIEGTDLTPEQIERLARQERMLHAVVSPTIDEAAGRSTLVFGVTKEHARRLTEIFNRHRAGMADCVTDDTKADDRADAIRRFKSGELQVLVGVGVFLEGFDAPNTAVVAVARPTKSESLYTQIIGRGTRPLDGLVDGPGRETADARKESIAASAKPHMTVLDFVGNSGVHKLVSTADILAGKNLPKDVQRAVAEAQAAGEAVDMQEAIEKAKRRRLSEEEEERRAAEESRLKEEEAAEHARRARLKAQAKYRTRQVDPFGSQAVPERVQNAYRGGSTDRQVSLLTSYGIDPVTAMGWGKSQAGAVISSLKAKTGGDYIVWFGKYRGTGITLREVAAENPGYIAWIKTGMQPGGLRNELLLNLSLMEERS